MKNKEKYDLNKCVISVAPCPRPNKLEIEYEEKKVFKYKTVDDDTPVFLIGALINWLEAEYVEPIRLTKNEKAILESLPKVYKWIARDSDIGLTLFYEKPHKGYKYWICYRDSFYFCPFNHLFQFIKWSDSEPYSIEELLKCEVVDDE